MDSQLHCPLTDHLITLGKIHTENPEYHNGIYQELLLTNRQYAFARKAPGSICLTAVNNDDKECTLSVPVPISASTAENLMDGSLLPVEHGKLSVILKGNEGVVFKIREE